jgi:hypothetical protein
VRVSVRGLGGQWWVADCSQQLMLLQWLRGMGPGPREHSHSTSVLLYR